MGALDLLLRTGVFGSVVLLAGAPAQAYAEAFDFDCQQVPSSSGLFYGPKRMHLQVDVGARQWCADTCGRIELLVREEGASLTLLDGIGQTGDQLLRSLDIQTGALVDVFAVGATWERRSLFSCVKEPFGGFAPYLARDAEPIGNPFKKFQAAGFLKDAQGNELEGSVGFRIEVDAIGNPSECKVTDSSGLVELDAYTCSVLMPGLRFRPAVDRTGQPISSSFESKVRWIVPRD